MYLLGCGALFAFYTAAIYLAVGLSRDREQLLEIALANYLWPALTVVFSIPILGKRASGWLWPGTGLALAGVFLVMTQSTRVTWGTMIEHLQTNPAAYGLALAAAVSWGLYSNLTRRWSHGEESGAVELFVPATGLILLCLRFVLPEPTQWTLRAGGEATALALITVTSYFLWDRAMRKGNLLLVAACSYFTPLLSTFVSCAYLGVSPGSRLWVGCTLVVCGSLLSWRSVRDGEPGETTKATIE
jgi:drug/metabolite transporter (DMT)-like permease